jgi:hypothetical protein
VSISGELKLELLSTWMRYEVAALTLPQLKVGVVSHVLLPFEGAEREGAGGVGQLVSMVNCHTADQEPLPQALEACTRQ